MGAGLLGPPCSAVSSTRPPPRVAPSDRVLAPSRPAGTARRSATLTVAASDASSHSREAADYRCDGIDDQAEIQAALDALPATGGKVALTEGTFNIAASVRIENHGVTLEGFGYGHETGATHDTRRTKLQAVRGIRDRMLLVQSASGPTPLLQGVQLRYFAIDGGIIDGAVGGFATPNTAVDCLAIGNTFGPADQWGTAAVNNNGTNCVVRNNVNWKTEASGTTTIDAGARA